MGDFLQNYGFFLLVAILMVLCHLGHGGHGKHGNDRKGDGNGHRH